MAVSARDHCGATGTLMVLSSGPVELQRFSAPIVNLTDVNFDFDDDKDGIKNVLEHASCGRFDHTDGAVPPQSCLKEDDPCCVDVSGLEGHMATFAGGTHPRADGQPVTLVPFALDATEVTWRQLSRCVAAGACLADQPDHVARIALADGVDANVPAQGLDPAQAQTLCEFFGKRLPVDDEWDFVAARRDGSETRLRYPWSTTASTQEEVGCQPEFDGVAANFSIPGQACAAVPVAVGKFPSSHAVRGAGGPLADLAGNVAEWTLVRGDSAPTIDEVPAGHDAVVLRGGGARSPLALLENDLPVVVRFPESGDVDAWRQSIQRLALTAGVRCALSLDDAAAEPVSVAASSCAGAE
jgi:formylglycine-generating enzyme required for sulfatase activity